MDVQDFFPIWAQLMPPHQQILTQSAIRQSIPKGTMLHSGSTECTGLLLVCSGQLRAFILSDEGREITLYRLFERDICLFSASCMLRSMHDRSGEGHGAVHYSRRCVSERSPAIRPGGELHHGDHGRPVFRGDVADGADHVEEL